MAVHPTEVIIFIFHFPGRTSGVAKGVFCVFKQQPPPPIGHIYIQNIYVLHDLDFYKICCHMVLHHI